MAARAQKDPNNKSEPKAVSFSSLTLLAQVRGLVSYCRPIRLNTAKPAASHPHPHGGPDYPLIVTGVQVSYLGTSFSMLTWKAHFISFFSV